MKTSLQRANVNKDETSRATTATTKQFKKINKDRKGEQKELYLPATGILRK